MALYEKHTVDEWLNLVDYDFVGYVPSAYALMFVDFIKKVGGEEGEENKTPLFHLVMMDRVFNEDRRCAILVFRGAAKCLDIYSRIATPNGDKLLRDIEVGDTIYDRNLKETSVTLTSPIYENKECYEITLEDNSKFTCTYDHKHFVQRRTQEVKNGKKKNTFIEEVFTTEELLSKGYYYNRTVNSRNPSGRETKYYIPLISSPIEYKEQKVLIDPYTFGCMLGDGNFASSTLVGSKEDLEELCSYIPYEVSSSLYDKRNTNVKRVYFSELKEVCKKINDKYKFIKERKFIFEEYLNNTIAVRYALLQGLMDTDGTIGRRRSISFTNISLNLCEGVASIVRSLGGRAKIKENKVANRSYWNVYIYLPKEFCPFRLKRKAERFYTNYCQYRNLIGIREITKVPNIPTKCISVDSPTKSYIFNDGYITHNTTLFSEYLILFIAAFGFFPNFGEVNLMMYVADSIENGVKNLRRNVEYRYENSEFLKKMIPNKKLGVGTNGAGFIGLDKYEDAVAGGRKFTDIRLEFQNVNGHRLIVKGYGCSTGVRGVKEMGKRPTVALLDDVVSDEDAKSPTVIENIENTVYKAVSKALHPKKQKIVWLGTPFNANDPLYKAVESGAWKVNVFPVCERFPVSKEEFKGAWEDRFDYEYVENEYQEAVLVGKPENFNQELMLRISSKEDRLVDDADIVWFDRKLVYGYRDNFNFYITTDFATSEKKSADFSVVSVWAVNNNGDYLLTDGWCEQADPSKFLNKVFEYAAIYNPLGVGIEVSGQQKTVVSWLRSEMIKKNIYMNLLSSNNSGEEGIRPNGDKFSRFVLVTPRFKQKKIWVANEMKDTVWGREFADEIGKAMKKGFKSKHDDVLDSISMLGSFEAYKPSATMTEKIDTPFEEEYEDVCNTMF